MRKVDIVVGHTIVGVRKMTQDELDLMWWDSGPAVVLVLDNGLRLFASRDEEGNGPGETFALRELDTGEDEVLMVLPDETDKESAMMAESAYGGSEYWKWECPKCGTENVDSFIATASPWCAGERCETAWTWEDLLTEEQMANANQFLDQQYKKAALKNKGKIHESI